MESDTLFLMWMLSLLGCVSNESPPEPVLKPALKVVSTKRVVMSGAVESVTISREPLIESRAVRWGLETPPCTGRCAPLQIRAQASSVLEKDEFLFPEQHAKDGKLETAWCGKGAVGEKLSLGMGAPHTVRQVLIAGWDGKGASLAEIDLVTDLGDRISVTLEPPNGKWPALGSQPPAINVLLEDVQFVQIEVRAVHGEGPICIAEVMLLGE